MPHEMKHVSKHALGVVAGAAIPAAVIGSLALAPAAVAAPAVSVSMPGSSAKSITPANIKIAEDQIKAHLIATRIPTLGFAAQASTKQITIPAGATLSGLAAEYDTSVSKLKSMNNLKSDIIIAGKSLKVPSSKASASTKSSTSGKSGSTTSYTVKSGDTLSHIAASHGMSLSSLLEKNDISASKRIFPGDKIKVSGSSSTTTTKPSSTARSTPAASSTYTVKAGDTLGAIAAKHNMSLSALLSKNSISASKVIHPGDKVKVSGSSAATTSTSTATSKPKSTSTAKTSSYTVKSGDTLGGIASSHDMKLATLLSLNGISASKPIFPGAKLKVSGSSAATTSTATSKPKRTSTAKTSSYTVKSGDTLGGIASNHDMKLAALLNLNPQISTQTPLKIGAVLKVSGSSVSSTSTTKTTKSNIGNTFEGRTYADHVVSNANENKDYLNSISVPSSGEMKSMVVATAKRMGVDPALALAHAMQESGFNMRAVSPANALGVMQVLPSTAEWMASRLGTNLNPLNPQDNVTAGVAVISYNLANTDSLDNAIASYYQGLSGVKNNGMYADTKRYVANVKSLMNQYK